MTAEPIFAPGWKRATLETEGSWEEFFQHKPALEKEGATEKQSILLSIDEAARLMGINAERVLGLIENETLCSSADPQTGQLKVQAVCLHAQLDGNSGAPAIKDDDSTAVRPTDDTAAATEEGTAKPETVDVNAPVKTEAIENSSTDAATATPDTSAKERVTLTSKNVEAIMDSLDFANVRLQGAMHRIGYLEAHVEHLQQQQEVLGQFRARAARAIITERENDELKAKISQLTTASASAEQALVVLGEDNLRLKETVACLEKRNAAQLERWHELELAWWFRLINWFCAGRLSTTMTLSDNLQADL